MTSLVKIEFVQGNFPVEVVVMNTEVEPKPHSQATSPVSINEGCRSVELWIHAGQYIVAKELKPNTW